MIASMLLQKKKKQAMLSLEKYELIIIEVIAKFLPRRNYIQQRKFSTKMPGNKLQVTLTSLIS